MVLDLMAQLDREFTERNKIELLLRELLDARRNRKSEQLSTDQLALFAAVWEARQSEAEGAAKPDGSDDNDAAPGGGEPASKKSTAGASLLAQVVVAKCADHLPLNRQEKIFERHGVDISRKTMGGWLAQCADLLKPLYASAKEVLFQSKVIGTDDTSVKVLDQ